MSTHSFDLSTADGRVRQWLYACLESIDRENNDAGKRATAGLADTLKITYTELDAFIASIQIDDGSEVDSL